MPNKKYIVDLTEAERIELLALTTTVTVRARKMKRAPILLKTEAGRTDAVIMASLDVNRPCVEGVRQRFFGEQLLKALNDRPRPDQRRKLNGSRKRDLLLKPAVPCQRAARLSARLLADRVVKLQLLDKISSGHRYCCSHCPSSVRQQALAKAERPLPEPEL